MTKLLEQVIVQLKTLPADEQDAIAARLLAEMENNKLCYYRSCQEKIENESSKN